MVSTSQPPGQQESAVAHFARRGYLNDMRIPWGKVLSWALGVAVLAVVVGVPIAHQRTTYVQNKRLRVVTDGRVYRSGQMTADGFRDAIKRYGIKTVINLQDDEANTDADERNPMLPLNPLTKLRVTEKEVVEAAGATYVQFDGNALNEAGTKGRAELVDNFLRVMDDEANYPVLYHCKAGLHRTGWITAVYRMEYEKRTRAEVLNELRANGFGDFKATDANVYIKRYIFDFQPGVRAGGYVWPKTPARGAAVCGGGAK
jgi:tyrosine-protein phosphatase SIW14